MYSSMATATSLAMATASTTVRAPLTASPPAKTPGRVVRPSGSTVSRPFLLVSMPVVVWIRPLSEPWLTEMMTPVWG